MVARTDRPVLDHLVHATRDLSAASADLAARTGVEPSGGGRHDGFGTQNRLASLGDGRYLVDSLGLTRTNLGPRRRSRSGSTRLTGLG